MRVNLVLFSLSALAVAGCNRSSPAASHAPPAKVESPVKETELTTITLTPEAEKRLGIETAEVAVQNIFCMGEVDGLRNFLDVLDCLLRRQRPGADRVGERACADEFHREKGQALLLAHIIDGHDVRMLQLSNRQRFGAKSLPKFGTSELASREYLQSDFTIQAELTCEIDDAHSAAADFFQ